MRIQDDFQFTHPPNSVHYKTDPTKYKRIHMMRDYDEYLHYIHIWTHRLLSMVMELNVNIYKYVSEKTKC